MRVRALEHTEPTFRRVATRLVTLTSALLVSACATVGPETDAREQAAPAPETMSTAGAYLAGRHADRVRDVRNASSFMDRVLASEGGGVALTRRTFLLRLEDGRYDDAAALADGVADTLGGSAPVAHIFLAVEAARTGDYDSAAARIARLPDTRLNRILRPLLEGWIAFGQGDQAQAESLIDDVLEIDGFTLLHALHSAMMADAAGLSELAGQRYQEALTAIPNPPLRIRLKVAEFLARQGRLEPALALVGDGGAGAADPNDIRAFLTAVAETEAGTVPSVQDGLAQAFFDLGSALQRDRRSELAMVFARLALRLDPGLDLATLLVAEILDDREQYAEALDLYDGIADRSAYRLMAALRAISSLEDLDRIDEAVGRLNGLADARPDLLDPMIRLGDLYRTQERWGAAVRAYDRAVARVPEGETPRWSLYYARGIALERNAQWDRAEGDFLKALELRPDQPYVLNYLGYTWIDQGRNLERATEMIERAVALRPNDGYIVDSLGWAMYRQARFEDAVTHLERAVELRPTDPTINDHLGDAYWRVGRRHEARFQWERALNFGPDATLALAIEEKLRAGLPNLDEQAVKTAGAGTDAES